MIAFFLSMEPPTITQQEHAFKIVNGRVVVYDPPRLRDARQKFMALLDRQRKSIEGHELIFPIEGPVRLITKWIWPKGDLPCPDGTWKDTRPDTDNIIKLFKDCMTRTGWWTDDAQVASEITEKFWGEVPGIYVKVELL